MCLVAYNYANWVTDLWLLKIGYYANNVCDQFTLHSSFTERHSNKHHDLPLSK